MLVIVCWHNRVFIKHNITSATSQTSSKHVSTLKILLRIYKSPLCLSYVDAEVKDIESRVLQNKVLLFLHSRCVSNSYWYTVVRVIRMKYAWVWPCAQLVSAHGSKQGTGLFIEHLLCCQSWRAVSATLDSRAQWPVHTLSLWIYSRHEWFCGLLDYI